MIKIDENRLALESEGHEDRRAPPETSEQVQDMLLRHRKGVEAVVPHVNGPGKPPRYAEEAAPLLPVVVELKPRMVQEASARIPLVKPASEETATSRPLGLTKTGLTTSAVIAAGAPSVIGAPIALGLSSGITAAAAGLGATAGLAYAGYRIGKRSGRPVVGALTGASLGGAGMLAANSIAAGNAIFTGAGLSGIANAAVAYGLPLAVTGASLASGAAAGMGAYLLYKIFRKYDRRS